MIRDPIIDRIGSIICDFVEIIRGEDDFDIKRATRVQSKKYFELTKSDFVSVKCWTNEHEYEQFSSFLYFDYGILILFFIVTVSENTGMAY